MDIAINSASTAVTNSIASIIALTGHRLVSDHTAAALQIVDMLHPHPNHQATNVPRLQLVKEGVVSDETLPCPFHPQSLIQRLLMLGNTHSIPLAQGWVLDMQARSLIHPSATLTLTEKECVLLKHLADASPHALTREDLLAQVWGMAGDADTHTLETHIYRLRAKLEPLTPTPCDILTQDGAYLLVLDQP